MSRIEYDHSEYPPDAVEAMDEFWQKVTDEAEAHDVYQARVAGVCDYRCFASDSNGRGRNPRRNFREIELVCYGGRWFQLRDGRGPTDDIAKEVGEGMGIPDDQLLERFIETVRRIPEIRASIRRHELNMVIWENGTSNNGQ